MSKSTTKYRLNLESHRRASKLTVLQIAEEANMTRPTVYNLEKHLTNPNVDNLLSLTAVLADHLDILPSKLFASVISGDIFTSLSEVESDTEKVTRPH